MIFRTRNEESKVVDEIAKASLLYDFYGALLTEKQRQVMALYHEENLSLSEIAGEFNISRQAVHDTLKKAELALEDYENKLNLIDKLVKTEEAINKIDIEIEKIAAETKDSQTVERLGKIKSIIDSLEG
ncbi:MAG: YlxM family DNA-binding protein [Firmicutes bacterium]|nr:YlxM family DNA-binding protein [Bacillota bacterium]